MFSFRPIPPVDILNALSGTGGDDSSLSSSSTSGGSGKKKHKERKVSIL